MERGEPGVEPRAGGADLEGDELDSGGKQRADGIGLAGAAEGNCCQCGVGLGAVFEGSTGDGEGGELANFGEEDFADFRVGLDEKEVVGGRRGEPLGDAAADVGCGHVEFADGAKESGDVLFEYLFWRGGRGGVVLYVDAAAVAEFGEAVARELAVSSADGVGVDVETAGELASAGKAVAGAEVSSKDGKRNLRDQLAVNGNFAGG